MAKGNIMKIIPEIRTDQVSIDLNFFIINFDRELNYEKRESDNTSTSLLRFDFDFFKSNFY